MPDPVSHASSHLSGTSVILCVALAVLELALDQASLAIFFFNPLPPFNYVWLPEIKVFIISGLILTLVKCRLWRKGHGAVLSRKD